MQIYQSDVDTFGSEVPPSFPSILVTVSAEHGPDTVSRIKYCVPLKVIKPADMKMSIIRSISTSDGKYNELN